MRSVFFLQENVYSLQNRCPTALGPLVNKAPSASNYLGWGQLSLQSTKLTPKKSCVVDMCLVCHQIDQSASYMAHKYSGYGIIKSYSGISVRVYSGASDDCVVAPFLRVCGFFEWRLCSNPPPKPDDAHLLHLNLCYSM